jgi:hypothetical protein
MRTTLAVLTIASVLTATSAFAATKKPTGISTIQTNFGGGSKTVTGLKPAPQVKVQPQTTSGMQPGRLIGMDGSTAVGVRR